MGERKHAKLKEKQKWSEEKLHLENARKLRGIYFIDLEDKELKETIKNARKKLETSMVPAMQWKIKSNKIVGVVHLKSKQNLRLFWKLVNLQDCVWKTFYQIIMSTILQERETVRHSMPSNENTRGKGSSGIRNGKNWRKLEVRER